MHGADRLSLRTGQRLAIGDSDLVYWEGPARTLQLHRRTEGSVRLCRLL